MFHFLLKIKQFSRRPITEITLTITAHDRVVFPIQTISFHTNSCESGCSFGISVTQAEAGTANALDVFDEVY